jgi:pyrroline-5-carboxylate reductase
MTLGFVGTGTIAAAIVEGLCATPDAGPILVSPRNADTAADLAARFAKCGSRRATRRCSTTATW